jgi:hypothetical protein
LRTACENCNDVTYRLVWPPKAGRRTTPRLPPALRLSWRVSDQRPRGVP